MTTEEVKKTTGADAIWDDIKDKNIQMFALPNQTVKQHVVKLDVPGDQLYLKLVSSSVLASLETTLADKYELEVAEKYVIIRPKGPDVVTALAQAERADAEKKAAILREAKKKNKNG